MIFVKRKYIPTDASVIRTIALAKGVSENGEDVRLLFLIKNPDAEVPVLKGIYTKCLSDDCLIPFRLFYFLKGTWRLLRMLHRDDDVILMSFLLPVFWVLSLLRINLYHERTEYPPLMFNNTLLGKIQERLYIKITKRTKGVFVISKGLKEYFISKGIKESQIHIINMIVDMHRFDNLAKNDVEPYIAYCGTVSNYKDGVDTLLKAFAIIHKELPNVNLHIYGRTPSQVDFKNNIQIIKENHLDKVVYMPGIIPMKEIPQRLKDAILLVLARPANIQAKYGFPTKLGEYLLTGNPVVVTRVGELSDYLTDCKSCVFAEPSNHHDLASKILWALKNPTEALVIGTNGKNVALTSFNYLSESKKIVDVLCK